MVLPVPARMNVRAVVVRDAPPITVALAYGEQRTMPEIDLFAELARATLTAPPAAEPPAPARTPSQLRD